MLDSMYVVDKTQQAQSQVDLCYLELHVSKGRS